MSQTLNRRLVELRGQAKAWLDTGHRYKFSPEHGICKNLPGERYDRSLLYDLMAAWPDGTSDDCFPVPHPTETPDKGFRYSNPQEKWDPQHEYARNRWALLEWLIEQTASEAEQ